MTAKALEIVWRDSRNMADSFAVSHLLKTDLGLKNTYLVYHQFGIQYL